MKGRRIPLAALSALKHYPEPPAREEVKGPRAGTRGPNAPKWWAQNCPADKRLYRSIKRTNQKFLRASDDMRDSLWLCGAVIVAAVSKDGER